MGVFYQRTVYALGAAGLSIPLGGTRKFYISVASDVNGSNVPVSVSVSGPGAPDDYVCPYGVAIPAKATGGNLVTVTGSGATLELILSDEPVDVIVQNVSISGKVSTSIDGQTVGVAPSTSEAGTAIDPRKIRSLTSTDTPKLASVVAADSTDPRQIRSLTTTDNVSNNVASNGGDSVVNTSGASAFPSTYGPMVTWTVPAGKKWTLIAASIYVAASGDTADLDFGSFPSGQSSYVSPRWGKSFVNVDAYVNLNQGDSGTDSRGNAIEQVLGTYLAGDTVGFAGQAASGTPYLTVEWAEFLQEPL